MLFYCVLRRIYWIRHRSFFATQSPLPAGKLQSMFAYTASSHSSPLRRNLSKEDSELQSGKEANIALALKCINGVVLKSGQIFSYWRLIKNPTKRRGFKKGMMLVNGKPAASIGGGLCALSNLIYWMTLHTPLTVIERFRHSYDVFPDSNRTVPFGSGATCVYNYRDLMIQNNTDADFALFIRIESGMLCGQWKCSVPLRDEYEVYQKEHHISCEGAGLYVRHNTLFRKHFSVYSGERTLISDDKIAENHALMMYEPLLETSDEQS